MTGAVTVGRPYGRTRTSGSLRRAERNISRLATRVTLRSPPTPLAGLAGVRPAEHQSGRDPTHGPLTTHATRRTGRGPPSGTPVASQPDSRSARNPRRAPD